MIPSHIRTAARARIDRLSDGAPTRRDLLKIGAGMIAGSFAGQAFLDPLTEPAAETVRAVLYGKRRVATFRATPLNLRRVATHGNRQQQAALAAWRERAPVPGMVRAKATMTYAGPDGSQWVDWQGGDVAHGLWGREHPRHVPMRDQPDPEFGAWAEKRIRAFRDAEEPALVLVSGRVERPDGGDGEQSYSVLMLPYSGGAVLTTAAAWPDAPGAGGGYTPRSYIPAPAVPVQPRLAST